MLKSKEETEKNISKYKAGIDFHQDFKDEEINNNIHDIKILKQQIEDWKQEIKQTEDLLQYYNKQIDSVNEQILETQWKGDRTEKEGRNVDDCLVDVEYEIQDYKRMLKPVEDKYIKQLNEGNSMMTWSVNQSVTQSYETRLSRMSKKESVLTNGDLKGSKRSYKSSVISSRKSEKSKRSK